MALAKSKLNKLNQQYEDALSELERYRKLLAEDDPMQTHFRVEGETRRWRAVVASLKVVLDVVAPKKEA